MTARPEDIVGADHRVAFEIAPSGLDGAVLFRTYGRYTGGLLVEIYARLAGLARGAVLNVIADTRASQNFVDYDGYDKVARLLTDRGVSILNLAVCDIDPGRRYVVKFGDEVARLAGLEVRSRFVDTLPAAVAALQELMQAQARGAAERSGTDGDDGDGGRQGR